MRKRIHKKDAYLKGIKGALPREVKNRKLKPVGIPEESIQTAIENYLTMKGIKFIHIPNSVYRMCAYQARTPMHVKKEIKEYLAGVPDIIAFKKEPECIDNSCLLLELKKENAKPRQNQKKWAKGLTVHYPDTIEKAIKLIEEWM